MAIPISHFTWSILYGETPETITRRIFADTEEVQTEGPCVIVDLERRPTSRESMDELFRIVFEAIKTGLCDGQSVPSTTLFRMVNVGVVIRDSRGQRVGNDGPRHKGSRCWDLYAQANAKDNNIVNIWALHEHGKHVAKRTISRDILETGGINHVDTQKFTFANTNTEITPCVHNFDIDHEIIFLDLEGGGRETKLKIKDGSTMKELITEYAEIVQCKSIKSLRFSHAGKPLFPSSVGKKLPAQLGLVNMDVILVSSLDSISEESNVGTPTKNKKRVSNKNGKKNKGSSKKKSTSGPRPVIEIKMSEKEEHSKVFSTVLREAEPILKEIRQKLNALTLERTQPKQKASCKKKANKAQDTPNCNPHDEDEGGNPGKPYYVIQVGEVANLYKSAKGNSPQKQRTRSLDLHGLNSKEAVSKLDEHLTHWVDIAMKGGYPFVIPVAIVCGGGNQILSKTVENWIKSKREVAKAPKSYFG